MNSFDYNLYWNTRDPGIRTKLFDREKVFVGWIRNNSKVLDMAVGNSFLPFFLKQEKNAEVTVFDISPVIVAKQKDKGLNGFVKDITSPDFNLEENYDYIILSEVLEHLALPEDVVNKVRNHAKYLVISIPNSAFYRHRISMLGGRFFKQWAVHPAEHLRYWSHKDFLDWLKAMDLEVIEHRAANGRPMPNLFANQVCYLVKGGLAYQ